MAYALLSRWGPEGFLAHCAGVAAFYRARRDVFERVARKHLSGLAEWTTPIAGMFLYIKVAFLQGLFHEGNTNYFYLNASC
jgi:tryptophan aminotransferase